MAWSAAQREEIKNSRTWIKDDTRKAGGYWYADKAAEHGVKKTYSNWFCRCPPCTRANTEAVRVDRERRRKELVWVREEGHPHGGYFWHPNPNLVHGTYTVYRNWHCRCHPCSHAERIEQYGNNHPRQSEDGNGNDLGVQVSGG